MKKQKSVIQFQIPEPCDQKWSEMTPTQGGRHCVECERTIVDFTKMSDLQLAHYYDQHQGKICGMFRADQLNHDIALPIPMSNWGRWKATAAVAAGLMLSGGLDGQSDIKSAVSFNKRVEIQSSEVENTAQFKNKSERMLKGIVTDKNGEVLIGCSVLIKGTKMGTVTDIDGLFELTIPNEIQNPRIEFSYTGFQTLLLDKLDFSTYQEIKLEEGVALEEVIVVGYGISKVKKEEVIDPILKGRVIDREMNYPLIGVNVLINGTSIGTVTDLNGEFELVLPKIVGDPVVVVQYAGYINSVLKISRNDLPNNLSIFLKEKIHSDALLGVVVSKKVFKRQKRQKRREKRIVNQTERIENQQISNRKKLANNISPNPFTNQIRIEIEIAKTDQYLINLYNFEGVLVRSEVHAFSKGKQNIELQNLPQNLAAGTYVLQVSLDNEILISEQIVKVE